MSMHMLVLTVRYLIMQFDEISEISPSKILELFTEVITENFPESVDI